MKLGNRWVSVSFDGNVARLGIGGVLVPFDSLEVLTREFVREEETAHRITALTNQTNQSISFIIPSSNPPKRKSKHPPNRPHEDPSHLRNPPQEY